MKGCWHYEHVAFGHVAASGRQEGPPLRKLRTKHRNTHGIQGRAGPKATRRHPQKQTAACVPLAVSQTDRAAIWPCWVLSDVEAETRLSAAPGWVPHLKPASIHPAQQSPQPHVATGYVARGRDHMVKYFGCTGLNKIYLLTLIPSVHVESENLRV